MMKMLIQMPAAWQGNIEAIKRLSRSPRVFPLLLKNYLSIIIFRRKVLRNLQLAVTYDCQYDCSLCAARHLNKDSSTLNVGQILKIVKEAKDLGCINVNLTGGEPLLRQELGKIVEIITKNGLMAGLITNGGLLDADLLKRLKSSGLAELAVSIHGDQEYHDNFTGKKGSYKRAIESIAMAKDEHLSVVVNTVITHNNLNNQSMGDLKKIARSFNILIQPILLCFPDAKLTDKGFALNNEDLQNLGLWLKDPYIRPSLHHNYFGTACPAGDEYIYIGAYGDVFMCDLVQIPFGNVLEESLSTIWQRMLSERRSIGDAHKCIGLENNLHLKKTRCRYC